MKSSRAILDEIAADNMSGAASILLRAVDFYRAVLHENCGNPLEVLDDVLIESGRALIRAQPEMAPLYSLAAGVLSALRSGDISADGWKAAARLLDHVPSAQRESLDRAIVRAIGHVPEQSTVLTISYSSSVRDLLARHPARGSLTVVIPESRPMCEGVKLAKALGEQGVSTILITDLALAAYVDRSDMFICGADAVTESYLVNKIGTAGISEIMRRSHKSTLALFTDSKLIKSRILRFDPRPHPESEITEEIVPLCKVENRYFEKCPAENFTHLVSESECYSPRSLLDTVRRIKYPAGLFRHRSVS